MEQGERGESDEREAADDTGEDKIDAVDQAAEEPAVTAGRNGHAAI